MEAVSEIMGQLQRCMEEVKAYNKIHAPTEEAHVIIRTNNFTVEVATVVWVRGNSVTEFLQKYWKNGWVFIEAR